MVLFPLVIFMLMIKLILLLAFTLIWVCLDYLYLECKLVKLELVELDFIQVRLVQDSNFSNERHIRITIVIFSKTFHRASFLLEVSMWYCFFYQTVEPFFLFLVNIYFFWCLYRQWSNLLLRFFFCFCIALVQTRQN